jgi:hypothetical protein
VGLDTFEWLWELVRDGLACGLAGGLSSLTSAGRLKRDAKRAAFCAAADAKRAQLSKDPRSINIVDGTSGNSRRSSKGGGGDYYSGDGRGRRSEGNGGKIGIDEADNEAAKANEAKETKEAKEEQDTNHDDKSVNAHKSSDAPSPVKVSAAPLSNSEAPLRKQRKGPPVVRLTARQMELAQRAAAARQFSALATDGSGRLYLDQVCLFYPQIFFISFDLFLLSPRLFSPHFGSNNIFQWPFAIWLAVRCWLGAGY